MMKNLLILPFLGVLLTLVSCGSENTHTETTRQTPDTAAEVTPEKENTTEPKEEVSEKKSSVLLKGTIADMMIVLDLTINYDQGKVSGTYYDYTPGVGLEVIGTLNEKNEVVLELPDNKGVFKGPLAEDESGITGTFTDQSGLDDLFDVRAFRPEIDNDFIAGTYENGTDDYVIVIPIEKDRFYFSIWVLTGEATCIGELSGVGTISDDYTHKFEYEGCSIDFNFVATTLKITASECSEYHGASCSFDGQYVKDVGEYE